MPLVESSNASQLAARCQNLRAEVKEWEKNFVAIHGCKAGLEDLKKHPDIAQKSKEYYRLRARLSSDDPFAPSSSAPPTKKRKLSASKPSALSPSSNKAPYTSQLSHPSELDPYDSPRAIHSTPRAQRTSIGPTPQKNGHVLGLFDLVPSPSAKFTPSKSASVRRVAPVVPNLQNTPSKPRNPSTNPHDLENLPIATPAKHMRTPQSSSKRQYLSTFLTPSHTRNGAARTPNSRRKGTSHLPTESDTPLFLRRNSQRLSYPQDSKGRLDPATTLDDSISWSPVAVRLPPPKPASRGLSALVRGLRGMEEEALDEDLEVLRQMEAEETEEAEIASVPIRANVMVQDGQVGMEMPLGADGTHQSSSEDETMTKEGRDRDGRPLRVWKKKGQKRTTRKSTMRPGTAKWKPEPEWRGSVEADDEVEDAPTVGATQVADAMGGGNAAEAADRRLEKGEAPGSGRDGDFEDSDDDMAAKMKRWKRDKAAAKAEPKAKTKKKVGATAHANFRTLNIKTKSSQGKQRGKCGKRR